MIVDIYLLIRLRVSKNGASPKQWVSIIKWSDLDDLENLQFHWLLCSPYNPIDYHHIPLVIEHGEEKWPAISFFTMVIDQFDMLNNQRAISTGKLS